jgi:hypothetical protein
MDMLSWLVGVALWLFVGALVSADSRRRYGRFASSGAGWVCLFGVVAVPFYLVYRVGHEPLTREERYRHGLASIERMRAGGGITEEGYRGRLEELRAELGIDPRTPSQSP